MLNFKPPESVCVCDAPVERGRNHEMTVIVEMLHGALMNIVVWRFSATTRS